MIETDFINLKVNGEKVTVRTGDRLLQAIEKTQNSVPTLCYDERIGPQGTCRMCLVEVKKNNISNYVASCTSLAEDNIEIFTHSETLIDYRKTLLELSLSEIKWDDQSMEKTKLTNNEFSEAVKEYKPENYFPELNKRKSIKEDLNPFIARDYDKCIACYRCTNICNDWEQASAITIDGRGQDSKIFSFFDNKLMNSDCTFCGQCVNTCPTGALSNKKIEKSVEKKETKTKSICPYCGVGCGIELISDGKKILGATPDFDAPSLGSLCIKGQFASWDFVNSKERLTDPLLKNSKGEFEKISWEKAYEVFSEKLNKSIYEKGPDSTVWWASARVVTEANYLLQKFARTVVGTNNIDNCSRT